MAGCGQTGGGANESGAMNAASDDDTAGPNGGDDASQDDTSQDDASQDDASQDDASQDDTSDDDTSDDDTSPDGTSDDDLSDDDVMPDAGPANLPPDDDLVLPADDDVADAGGVACSDADRFTSVSEGPVDVSSNGPNQLASYPLPDERVLFLRSASQGAIYSARDDTWTPLPMPPDPVAVQSSRMVVVGQRAVCWRVSAEESVGAILDLDTLTWSEMNATGAPTQSDSVRLLAVDGQVLVFGGDTTGVDYGIGRRFDPEANQWSVLGGDPGLVQRDDFVEAVMDDGLLVWGGFENIGGNLSNFDQRCAGVRSRSRHPERRSGVRVGQQR
jgi:hypothetical protein